MSLINNCTFCGTEISSEFTYCPKCGNKQTNENVQVSNEIDPIVHFGNEKIFLDSSKIVEVALMDGNSLKEILFNAFQGVEFDKIKYALWEVKARQIKLSVNLEKRIIYNYKTYLTDDLQDVYLNQKQYLISIINKKTLELEKEKVIKSASATDEELIQELINLGHRPTLHSAKYILLEMLSREMKEFLQVSNQVHQIDLIPELKPKYDKLKQENELAIYLNKTNKRLNKYEKNDLANTEEKINVDEPIYELEEEPNSKIYSKWWFWLIVVISISALYSNKNDLASNVKEKNTSNSNECSGTGNESCINQVRQNFTNSGKTILGERYLGDGRFGISFLDVENLRNRVDNGTYEAAVSTDCNCNLTNVQVSRIN